MPSITLPKGGGAIRGMGEKFAANAVTGTASLSVPITVSSGRAGFGPELSLSYDSGSGNGPFGMGWSLSVPAITRKTDKGLPEYRDAEESDDFLLSGSDDLVPVLVADAAGEHRSGGATPRTVGGVTYQVRRYRPRIEGQFARIERWTSSKDADDVFWRSISRDNVTSWYGRTPESRISDPEDSRRIFSWLLCQTHDDKGNVVVYGYKTEDSARIFEDRRGTPVARAHERNRTPTSRSAQRYLKRIRYGNRTPYLPVLEEDEPWPAPPGSESPDGSDSWLFEAVLDYGEHDTAVPVPGESGAWPPRSDPFSSFRPGFEVRTYRTCRRVLMFHHFPGEDGVESDCLVQSTSFTYSGAVDPLGELEPVLTLLRSVTQTAYRRNGTGYDTRSMPPLDLTYTQPVVQDVVHEVDASSVRNLPVGLDGSSYRWTDLEGEGLPGILTEQAGAWFYKRNLSPVPDRQPDGRDVVTAKFAPLETVALAPVTSLTGGAELMDLAGDGRPDVVVLSGPMPGFYERDEGDGWLPFRAFTSRLNRDVPGPYARLVDLNGDGRADVLVTEDEALVWHASLAEEGFGPARRVAMALDEEQGPRVVLAESTQSVHLADLSGDGLTDLVRIRNGEVCYWPNLGHGRFGAKVTMDGSPWFDHPEAFDQRRLRLADIDGSGTTDIIYLHREGVRLYFNQAGNSWGKAHELAAFPRVDDSVRVEPVDLLGNGTACLVWSSPLPGDAGRQLRYVDLMGGTKPHLLVEIANNLGAETRIDYAPSTRFYLLDKQAGRPWVTRLPFPVHVVERVTTNDHVGRNRFVTRYAYHHGYFDGPEREFRGFGMVEQWDTEELAALADGQIPDPTGRSTPQVPPVRTRTWFHTGQYVGRDRVARHFAGLLDAADEGEYFREPGRDDAELADLLLPDTVIPVGLTVEEEREACRALKGVMLRHEVYADDQAEGAGTPYTVAEQTHAVRCLQPRGGHRHAVFLVHALETVTYHYERTAADPRIQHALTLEIDAFGNVLKQASIGYGRRREVVLVDETGVRRVPNPGLSDLDPADQLEQTTTLVTYSESRVTNAVDEPDSHRAPLACESVTFELTGYSPTGPGGRFRSSDLVHEDPADATALRHTFTDEVDYEEPVTSRPCRRCIEWRRTLFRQDNLDGLSPLGELGSRALPGEQYSLAYTAGLLAQVFRRSVSGEATVDLVPDPAALLEGHAGDVGGYLSGRSLKSDGRFPATDADDRWWVPSGRTFFTADRLDPTAELAFATEHWFLPRRHRDPFDHDAHVEYDDHDLLTRQTRDALGNTMTVDVSDYRVLQPRLVSDANGNRTELAFDTLGMVVGTAVMGKPPRGPEEDEEGDTLAGFDEDLSDDRIEEFFESSNPRALAPGLLEGASTRTLYDLDRFRRTRQAHPDDPGQWSPACVATLARETHLRMPLPPHGLRVQISLSHSDGFGREIQKKSQAEPGPLAVGEPDAAAVSPRWLATGWTIFDNKGNPVRQYEPFFSGTPAFEFGVLNGVSPVLFYDPVGRVVATLHPDHTYEKVVFDPWQQVTYDTVDTCAAVGTQTGDPRTDPDVGGLVSAYFATQPATWQTWHERRAAGALGTDERDAAVKAAAHADTPATVRLDALGRPFLNLVVNRVVCEGHDLDGTDDLVVSRTELDIEGNEREVVDQRRRPVNHLPTGVEEQRVVASYAYDMLGKRIFHATLDAGARWVFDDVAGNPIRAWDSRGHTITTTYDALRRPVEQSVVGSTAESDPRTLEAAVVFDRIEYGENIEDAETLNLRTRVYRHFDTAGVGTNAHLDADGAPTCAYDFKGNLLHTTRQLVSDYTALPDWSRDPLVEDERFEGATAYDAFNRPVQVHPPRSGFAGAERHVIQPSYNERGLLRSVDVWLERAEAPGSLLDPTVEPGSAAGVSAISYDAKGQRLSIGYQNGATTRYRYDPETLRLVELYTRRGAAFAEDADNPNPPPTTVAAPDRPPQGRPAGVQNLQYTYDPAGNITSIVDQAQPTIFFRNKRVDPSNHYRYDATYRLIEASGREHLAQGRDSGAYSSDDSRRENLAGDGTSGLFAPDDGTAMGRYVERYVYDAVGGLLQMQHSRADADSPGWTRRYAYDEGSLVEPGQAGNRLSSTQLGQGPNAVLEAYLHDAHGNIVRMPHLGGGEPDPNMAWDFKDHLSRTDHGGGGQAFYGYDTSGQRVRKVWEKAPGLTEERIYLGGFEVFRIHGGQIGTDSARLERETLHVADGARRIALVETRTLDAAGDDPSPRRLVRYQCGNHLGSATLELDEQARIISYTEYAPFGSTTYRGVRSRNESTNRYRFSGKERDEQTGLYVHGARYYAPWLARWTSCDPGGLADGPNLYAYCSNNPVTLHDPDGRAGEPPPQLHLIEQAFIDTVGTLKGYSQESLIQRFVQNFARLWGEDPSQYEAGHAAATPQWSTPPGGAQKIGPQNKDANNLQSQQEARDRAAAAARGGYHRTGRAHTGPGTNPPSAPLTPEIRQIANLDPDEAGRLPSASADGPAGSAPAAPASPQGEEGRQLGLDFNKPAAKSVPAAPPAAKAPAPAVPPAAPAVKAPAVPSGAGSGIARGAARGAGMLPSVAKGAGGVAVGLAGGLARNLIPGAAEALEFAAASRAVGVANAGRLLAQSVLPRAMGALPRAGLSLAGRAGWVGVAAVAGVATGYVIERAAPGYTAHAADVGEAVRQKSGSLVLGGVVAAASVIPGAWAATRVTKGWLW